MTIKIRNIAGGVELRPNTKVKVMTITKRFLTLDDDNKLSRWYDMKVPDKWFKRQFVVEPIDAMVDRILPDATIHDVVFDVSSNTLIITYEGDIVKGREMDKNRVTYRNAYTDVACLGGAIASVTGFVGSIILILAIFL